MGELILALVILVVMIVLTIAVKKQREKMHDIYGKREEIKSWITAIKETLWWK